MAPLTWRNVDAPSFSGVNQALALAAQNFNSGFDGISKTLGDFQDGRTINDSNALILEGLKYQDPAAYKAALMNGTVTNGVDPRNLNAGALDFLNNHTRTLYGDQQAGANLVGTNISNQGAQFGNDQAVLAAQRADVQRAALPQANQLAAEIRTLAGTGDPSQMAKARQLQVDNAGVFTAAGIDPLSIIEGNNSAFTAGMGTAQAIAGNEDFFKNRYGNQEAERTVAAIVADKSIASATDAIRAIQASDLPSDVMKKAVADLQSNADLFYQPPATGPQALLDQADGKLPTTPGGLPSTNPAFISYTNQNAKRNDPLSPRLTQAMSFLPELGVTMEVFSGGQEDNHAHGTGSTRHNGGNAGDVRFRQGDRVLDWDKPADVPILQEIVRKAKANGLTGFGAGDGYMQGTSTTHIGFGNPGVWGAGGRGANANPALKAAFDGSPQGKSMGEAPIDITRPQLPNNDGSVSTERTITIQDGDKWVNIPTIVNGQRLAEAEAIDAYKSGNNPATGRFTNVKDADEAAQARSDEIGRMLSEAATQPSVSAPTPSDQATLLSAAVNPGQTGMNVPVSSGSNLNINKPVITGPISSNPMQDWVNQNPEFADLPIPGLDSPRATMPPRGVSAVVAPIAVPDNASALLQAAQPVNDPSISNMNLGANTLATTAGVDRAFNPNESVDKAIATAQNSGEDRATVVARLKAGPLSGIPETAITQAISDIINQTGTSPAIAGALAANAIEARDLGGAWGPLGLIPGMGPGDKFGGATEGRTAPRINVEQAVASLKDFQNRDQNGVVSSLVARQLATTASQSVGPQVANIQSAITQAQAEYDTLVARAAQYPDQISPDRIQAAKLMLDTRLSYLQAKLEEINKSGNATIYSDGTVPK